MKVLLLIVLGVLYVSGEEARFDNYRVYRISPKNQEQIDLLLDLEKGDNDLDFWSETNPSGRPVDIMVSPKDQGHFIDLMNSNEIPAEIMIEDVQKLMNMQDVSRGFNTKMTWTQYYRIDEIHAWLDTLPVEYPGIVEIISAGSSYENRDIKGVKISYGAGRRGVFIEGGIHACEWISPATVNYLINELLTSTDPAFRNIAESFDWHIFPNINPDGYAYSHSTNRLWRKTRTTYPLCDGADPNRNFDFHWGEEGSSDDTCSEMYSGPHPFSEMESLNLARYIDTIGSTLDVYLAIHSYSQLILLPYGYTEEHLDNYDDLYIIAAATAESIGKRYNTWYTYGSTAEMLYKTSGSSRDFVKDKYKIPIVYTIELRDTGRYGFLLPSSEIIPNCLEIMDGLVTLFEESENLGYFELRKSMN